ncbi:MAG TPA: 2OG-Fe(II) oxygenase [Candidatus Binataceae bacterium]|nr:2OG-Fe(II) oxygenase [Candidatus Binataceae bacterium]
MILSTADSLYGFFGPEAANIGRQFHERYISAQPFPHIVLDDFLSEEILDRCLCDFPSHSSSHISYDRAQERGKFEFKPDTLSAPLRSLFYSFNSAPFILFLENLTGIRGLIPDPYFAGGGLHEVVNGGHLNIHADFNHQEILNLERRLNVLIYLNRDWREEYGGCLELWDQLMLKCVERVVPSFNRCVIFNTSPTSYHGNPEPVNHPSNLSRRAIALYYYTASWSDSRHPRNTRFQRRANSADAFDLKVRTKELVESVTPPILLRAIRGVLRRLHC